MPAWNTGLTSAEAAARLRQYGRNEIKRQAATPWWTFVLAQFRSLIVWLLLVACVVSVILGETGDAIAIGCILILNAWVGFRQEYAAERAVLALRAMTAPKARVRRDGRLQTVEAEAIVVGDLLVLEAGDTVPADALLREAAQLQTIESALTGESQPVAKQTEPCPPNAPLAERHDHVYLGTAVATGTALAEVTATGGQTELGKIAHLLGTVTVEQTPLQARLERVGRSLVWLCLGIVAIVAVLGLLRGLPPLEVLMLAVSLAVAAVPEGLPAIVTIALAVGVKRMAARQVLVRRLAAVETLGSATVICTDKTGTLTAGEMRVRDVWAPDRSALLHAAAACCNADWQPDDANGKARSVGDPTEVALLEAAAADGHHRMAIEAANPRQAETPFDSVRRRMAIHRADGTLYVKGAPESVIPLCTEGTEGADAAAQRLAADGLRVLAVATGQGPEERGLRLIGLIGLADPPRPEAIKAVAAAKSAGIRTVMITGDNATTAHAIAREMFILDAAESPDGIVHARATPADKLRIIGEWKAKGAIVAMTGDGVNDAPALREAHIGIAMGKNGTDVSREAADMVLMDDNFASIVAAISEGRGIQDNITKTLIYLLSGNLGELLLMLGAAVLGFPMPLLPLQLLWINLVTDGLPALVLVMEPVEPGVLDRPPRRPDAPILGRPEWRTIVSIALLETTVTLGIFVQALTHHPLAEARNLAFSTLVVAETLRALAARSRTRPFWQLGLRSNPRLLAVVLGSLAVQVAIQHVPFTQRLFGIGAVPWLDSALALGAAVIPLTCLEISKVVRQRWARQK